MPETEQSGTNPGPSSAPAGQTPDRIGQNRTKKRFLAGDCSPRAATEFAETFPKIPTLLTTWTRCGKPRCRCQAHELHGPYHYLRWREGTTQRRRYVRAADVPAVRAILDERHAAQRRERLDHARATVTWRQMARQLDAIEARIREERANR